MFTLSDGGIDGSKDTVVLNGKYADYGGIGNDTRFNGNDYNDLKLTNLFQHPMDVDQNSKNVENFVFNLVITRVSKIDLSNRRKFKTKIFKVSQR